MWFGKSQVTVTATTSDSPTRVVANLRGRLLALGGTIESEAGGTIVGCTAAHTILGKSFLFATWYGKVPVRLRLRASESQEGMSTVRLECDFAAILSRFRWVFAGMGAFVIVPVAVQGWRQDPSVLLTLLIPYVICLFNFLPLRIIFPDKLRRAFQMKGLWWEG